MMHNLDHPLVPLVREFIRLLDIVEESDNGRQFHPNYISSCRSMDAAKMIQCVEEMRLVINGGS